MPYFNALRDYYNAALMSNTDLNLDEKIEFIKKIKKGLDDGFILIDDIAIMFKNSLLSVIKGNEKKGWEKFGFLAINIGAKFGDEKNYEKAKQCWKLVINDEINFRKYDVYNIIEDVWRLYALMLMKLKVIPESIEAWKHHMTLIQYNITKHMPLIDSDMVERYSNQNQDALYNIGLCYYYEDDFSQAEVYVDKLFGIIDKTDFARVNNALNLKAYIHSSKKEYSEAIKCHDVVILNIISGKGDATRLDYEYASLACNYADNNDIETAQKTINKVTTSNPDPYILDMYGYVSYKQGHYDDAIEHFDKALSNKTDDPLKSTILFHKGNALLQQKKYSDSRRFFDKSLGITRSSKAYNNKAVAYAFEKDQENAISQLRKALTEPPPSPTVIENIAKLHSSSLTNRSFLDYWMSSLSKQLVFIGISILILGIISVNIFIPALLGLTEKPESISTNKPQNNSTNNPESKPLTPKGENINSTATERLIQGLKNNTVIGGNNLALIGILVVILLLPVISSAKIGTSSLELTMVETKGSDVILAQFD
jgi:tetratricopeptide (TPR) repeat protein